MQRFLSQILSSHSILVFWYTVFFLLIASIYIKFNLGLRNKLRKYFNGKISRLIKKGGTKIIGGLWGLYIFLTFYHLFESEGYDRLFITIFFVSIIIFLNYYKLSLYFVTATLFELIYILLRPIFYRKKSYKQKVESILRLNISNIAFIGILLLSFSLELFLTNDNYQIIGFLLYLFIVYYLIKSLADIFIAQKDLIQVANHLEMVSNFLDALKTHKGTKDITIIVTTILSAILVKEKSSKVMNGIKWAKEKLKRLNYLSKLGISIFKTYLTLRLIITVVLAITFVLLTLSNFFIASKKVGLITDNISYYSEYLLQSFYIFTGQSVNSFSFNGNEWFFNTFFLITGLLGWLIVVAYIILFIDILSISLNEFYNSINSLINKVLNELNDFFGKIMDGKEQVKLPSKYVTEIKKHLEKKEDEIANIDTIISELDEIEDKEDGSTQDQSLNPQLI